MVSLPAGVRGFLFDVDGTLLHQDRAIPGAAEALTRLRRAGLAFRLTTNTSRRPRAHTGAILRKEGFDVRDVEILVPAVLARKRIVESGRTGTALLVPPEARADFEGVRLEEDHPDWVVVGDLGSGFTWETLNRAFHWIRGGARLLALHKNRFWDNGQDGIVLDAGPFVEALEYATGTRAELVGKPARPFFDLAVGDLGLPAGQVLVVGDDLEADCAGASGAGCLAALVLTGRTRRRDLEEAPRSPDLVLESVADLVP